MDGDVPKSHLEVIGGQHGDAPWMGTSPRTTLGSLQVIEGQCGDAPRMGTSPRTTSRSLRVTWGQRGDAPWMGMPRDPFWGPSRSWGVNMEMLHGWGRPQEPPLGHWGSTWRCPKDGDVPKNHFGVPPGH